MEVYLYMVKNILKMEDKTNTLIYVDDNNKVYQTTYKPVPGYVNITLALVILIPIAVTLILILSYLYEDYLEKSKPKEKIISISEIDFYKLIYDKPRILNDKFKYIRIWKWTGNESINKNKLQETISYLIDRCNISSDINRDDLTNLLLETCAVESDFGKLIKQVNGPALSIYQIEPNTYNFIDKLLETKYTDIYNFTKYFIDKNKTQVHTRMCNIPHGTIAALVYYLHTANDKLKDISTREKRASIWKTYYNTHLGKGTVESYLRKSKLYLDQEA